MSVIKCSHCGKDLPSEAKFCPYCMERLSEPVMVELPQEKKKPDGKSIIIIIISLILALLLLTGTAFFLHYKKEKNDANVNNNISTEDVNKTENTNSTENLPSKENNAIAPDIDNPAQNKPVDENDTDKEENKTTNITNDNTSTTNNPVDECEHNWVAITAVVHHDEVGHYEIVKKQRPITQYKCPVCYEEFTSIDTYYSHFDSTHKPSYSGDPISMLRNQYTTESGYEYYETQEWIVDKKAYDETVVTGYKCSVCGEKKNS